MIFITVGRSTRNSKRVELAHVNIVVDPMPMDYSEAQGQHTYSCSINGTTLTIARTDEDEGKDWTFKLHVRAYNPTGEVIPDFTSTTYAYYGLDGEEAPRETTAVVIRPSVTTIQGNAFNKCKSSLVRVTMDDNVTRIEREAFAECVSLRSIRFSINLVYIGIEAFYKCTSLEAVFLPPTAIHGYACLQLLNFIENVLMCQHQFKRSVSSPSIIDVIGLHRIY